MSALHGLMTAATRCRSIAGIATIVATAAAACPTDPAPRAASTVLAVQGAGPQMQALSGADLARLPAWEDALVMSIHKSQGSEFDRVAVVLPEAGSPLLGRELLYTALTRARRGVLLYAGREALAAAIDQPLRRAMGLGRRLWGQAGQGDRG